MVTTQLQPGGPFKKKKSLSAGRIGEPNLFRVGVPLLSDNQVSAFFYFSFLLNCYMFAGPMWFSG